MRTPNYESELHVEGDKRTDRKNIALPAEIYDNFIALADELDFSHKGRVAVVPLLDALSQLDPEVLELILDDAGLLPRCNRTDSLWR